MLFFGRIRKIQEIIARKHVSGTYPYHINDIADAIAETCNVDEFRFNKFTDKDNPILGRYKRWEASAGVYAGTKTVVDIEYSADINHCESRFVVCKEMCQALLDDPAVRANTEEVIETLIGHLTLPDISKDAMSAVGPFASEKLAVMAAAELLCPIIERKKFLPGRMSGMIRDRKSVV